MKIGVGYNGSEADIRRPTNPNEMDASVQRFVIQTAGSHVGSARSHVRSAVPFLAVARYLFSRSVPFLAVQGMTGEKPSTIDSNKTFKTPPPRLDTMPQICLRVHHIVVCRRGISLRFDDKYASQRLPSIAPRLLNLRPQGLVVRNERFRIVNKENNRPAMWVVAIRFYIVVHFF
ncbi:hypothetical protein MFFC18_15540 [Mariniblastus fucicola]|uniref:Uncharacterized protein n=1 Tax=Mariniblastus fucicola TaxID=980251 RepID=A0A5B9P8Y9_9BACT|nr:hypothetical protein MFFC18_15540 [Mariniblastus fucicola]